MPEDDFDIYGEDDGYNAMGPEVWTLHSLLEFSLTTNRMRPNTIYRTMKSQNLSQL